MSSDDKTQPPKLANILAEARNSEEYRRESDVLADAIKRVREAYEALAPVDKALADSDQRRSYVEGLGGRDPGDVLADEVRRLRSELANVRSACRGAGGAVDESTNPETPGTWEERCTALYQVIGCLAGMVGIFVVSDDIGDALDVAAGRGNVFDLLPWPKNIGLFRRVEEHCKGQFENAAPESNEPAAMAADARRFRLMLRDPEGARHLLHLLQQGKGDEAAFRKMLDRIVASREASHVGR